MVSFIEPRVIKLAETRVDQNATKILMREYGQPATDWLASHSKGWTSDAEMLIEIAGRVCYRSFGTGLNPNITQIRSESKDYFENVLRKGDGSIFEHGTVTFALMWVSRVFCYSADTEVLTSDGWKRFDTVQGNESFLTLNPNNCTMEYLKPAKLVQVPYNGRMIRIQSTIVDLLVTPNHRIFQFDYDKRSPKSKVWKFSQADTLLGRRFRLKTSGIWSAIDQPFVKVSSVIYQVVCRDGSSRTRQAEGFDLPGDAFATFMGFYQSEGHLFHVDGTGYGIQLSQSFHSPHVSEMVQAIRKLGFQPRTYPAGHSEYGIRFFSMPLFKYLEKYGRRFSQKRVPNEIKSLSSRQIRLYLEAYTKGDGSIHKKNGHKVIYTSSKQMADDLQELALKAGYSASIRIDDRVGKKHFNAKVGFEIAQTVPNYIVSFRKESSLDPMINQARKKDRRHVREEDYSGIVYCVSVPPNELLYVRRNGKPVWCGNTHELVRHRVGTAYSQESLRYVRPEEVQFPAWSGWIPVEIEEDTRKNIVKALEDVERHYVSIQAKLPWDKMNFDQKKRVTSALRRLLPQGVATAIIFTANHRTLRWLIEMRTDAAAEIEIRKVFGEIAEICIRDFPLIYSDFKSTVASDGIRVYKPSLRSKV